MFERLKGYREKLPRSFRSILKPLGTARWLVRDLKKDHWIIRGEGRAGQEELVVGYAGKEEYKKYFVTLAFGETAVEEHLGKAWAWNRTLKARMRERACSLMVTDVPKAYRRLFMGKNRFYIPAWIDGGIDSSSPLTRSAKSDIQKLKKNRMHFEITSDPAKFDLFYHTMHVPYIANAYGDLALIYSYAALRSKFGARGLYNAIFLLKNEADEDLAGVLVGTEKDRLFLHFLGVKDGNLELIKEGVIGILFSYPVLYAKENGYAWVNFGMSRPFVNDGALNFKRKRGLKIADTFPKGYVVEAVSKSRGVKSFLVHNPFIYGDKKGLACALFLDDGQTLSAEDFTRIYNDHHFEGLSRFVVYPFGETNRALREAVPAELADVFSIESADALF